MIATGAGLALSARPLQALAADEQKWSYPIAFPGGLPGEELFIKHGYACEHATFYPGLLHTGENWYGIDRNAIEADVIASADGEVVYADFDYPGRVVIVQHEESLYSVYGHLDYALSVDVGQRVNRGERLGSPLAFPDGIERTHLHFEIRSFYISDLINGNHPSHGFTCGYQCPPGPGYWPIDAVNHPSELGWMNPTHVIQNRLFDSSPPLRAEAVATSDRALQLWMKPSNHADAEPLGDLVASTGERFPLLAIATGEETSTLSSAFGYRLWYGIVSRELGEAWVEATQPSTDYVGNDGRPSAILFNFLPVLG